MTQNLMEARNTTSVRGFRVDVSVHKLSQRIHGLLGDRVMVHGYGALQGRCVELGMGENGDGFVDQRSDGGEGFVVHVFGHFIDFRLVVLG